jgi:hypothetical protein
LVTWPWRPPWSVQRIHASTIAPCEAAFLRYISDAAQTVLPVREMQQGPNLPLPVLDMGRERVSRN